MKRYLKICTLLSILLMNACVTGLSRVEQLDIARKNYESAMRWGQYGFCLSAHKNPSLSPARKKQLESIRVTKYEVVRRGIAPDKLSATQIVMIKYYNREYSVVKVVKAVQNWKYEKQTGWKIESPFPEIN